MIWYLGTVRIIHYFARHRQKIIPIGISDISIRNLKTTYYSSLISIVYLYSTKITGTDY